MASKSSPSPVASQSGSPPPPPADLRHMTSNSALASPSRDHRRTSQHLRTDDPRVGSKSPSSIPSSPTSIHSSSSAIFERDIEPMVPPSPPILLSQHTHHHHPPNPHRIPRAKGTGALEHSVPSVLDSAAAVLSTLETDADVAEQVAVVAPVASPLENVGLGLGGVGGRSSGFASPIGSFRSRSPSPLGSRRGAEQQLLLNIPPASGSQPQPLSSAMASPPVSALGLQGMTSGAASTSSGPSSTSASSPSSKPLAISTADPMIISQTLAAHLVAPDEPSVTSATPAIVRSSTDEDGDVTITSTSESEEGSEPPTTTQEHPPAAIPSSLPSSLPLPLPISPPTLPSPPSLSSTTSPISSPSSAHAPLAAPSHPPSPAHVAKKRLSFMSYSDLLSATPAGLQPLSALTTLASAEPPPHIPSVSGLNLVNALHAQAQSPTQSQSQSPHSGAPSLRAFPLFGSPGAPGAPGGVTHAGKRDSIAMLDNVGGEWEKQGLGKGLEERLEALVIPPPGGAVSVGGGKA